MSRGAIQILLVEDDRQIRQVIRELLQGEGREVTVMEDGRKAFKLLQKRVFDLLVTDLGLPGSSGWVLIGEGRKLSPELKVIVITSWTDCHSEEYAREYKVDHIIKKPFRINQILDAVENVLVQEPISALKK